MYGSKEAKCKRPSFTKPPGSKQASGNEYIIEFFPYEKKCKKENSSGETELLDTVFE